MKKVIKRINKQEVASHIDIFAKALMENGKPTGLNLNIENFLHGMVENNLPANELEGHIHDLMRVAINGQLQQTENVLRYFLGRGIGSTPAGDDHVIGLLGIHALTGTLHPDFIQTVKHLTETESITTRAGLYYLHHALDGEFLPPFAHILDNLEAGERNNLQEQISQVLPIGHTSGIDTIFGMLIGMWNIKNKP